MTMLVYTVHKAYCTEDIVLPCSGEVLADAGEVQPFQVVRILGLANDLPKACWQGQADCDNCPIYLWTRRK